jgi:hypothetical protein
MRRTRCRRSARAAPTAAFRTPTTCLEAGAGAQGPGAGGAARQLRRERVYAADENILNSTRATDFITPKSAVSKLFRNAVLELARSSSRSRASS